MVYFIPNSEKTLLTDRVLEKENVKIAPVKKRLVTSYNDFKEKIILFEAGLDDMAAELTNCLLYTSPVRKCVINHQAGYACRRGCRINGIYVRRPFPAA